MSVTSQKEYPNRFRNILSHGFDKFLWGLYRIEAGRTSSEAFALRFQQIVDSAQNNLHLIDSAFVDSYRLRQAAMRGVSIKLVSNIDETSPALVPTLQASGINVNLLNREKFQQIPYNFVVADGQNIIAISRKSQDYFYVEKTKYLGKIFTNIFQEAVAHNN